MKNLIIILCIILAGCKTLGDVRQNKPSLVFESNKTVNSVSECILYGWENEKDILGVPFGVFIQPFPNGKTVYVNSNIAVADVINDEGERTLIKLYLPKYDIWLPTVKGCI
ncbi:hypothetical protein [Pectobacterium cacticida]|uniref:hypothetical protein n=1 Tax=Pectobacterium cacticida TaxID=69221 RepID=UPI0039857896